MTGSPAGPTVAPSGSVAAAASVAGADATVVVPDEVVEDEESVLVDEVPELDESVGGGVVGGVEAASPDWARSIAWNCTPERAASRWSWTSRLACSLSAGTALPSTT